MKAKQSCHHTQHGESLCSWLKKVGHLHHHHLKLKTCSIHGKTFTEKSHLTLLVALVT